MQEAEQIASVSSTTPSTVRVGGCATGVMRACGCGPGRGWLSGFGSMSRACLCGRDGRLLCERAAGEREIMDVCGCVQRARRLVGRTSCVFVILLSMCAAPAGSAIKIGRLARSDGQLPIGAFRIPSTLGQTKNPGTITNKTL